MQCAIHITYAFMHLKCVGLQIILSTLSPGASWCSPLSCCPEQTAADPADHNGGSGLDVANGADVHSDGVDPAN